MTNSPDRCSAGSGDERTVYVYWMDGHMGPPMVAAKRWSNCKEPWSEEIIEMSRIAPVQKISAIIKMKKDRKPPVGTVRSFIGSTEAFGKVKAGDIYTMDLTEADLKDLESDPDVISMEYARPVHALGESAQIAENAFPGWKATKVIEL